MLPSRVCPGQHVADRSAEVSPSPPYIRAERRLCRSVFINTALVLWAFEISEDPACPIDSMAIHDGALAHPEDFTVKFTPRISKLREMMEAYGEDA